MANVLYSILMCRVCGNMVKVLKAGHGSVVCCNHAMEQINKPHWGA